MNKTVLDPVDWIIVGQPKSPFNLNDSDKHKIEDMFAKRMRFENFNISYFDDIEIKLRNYLKYDSNDCKLKLYLVTLLIENRISNDRLYEAKKILSTVNASISKSSYKELNNTINEFIINKNMNKKKIKMINWGIYNRCPLICKGCYNIFNNNILDIKSCKSIVNKVHNYGAEFILLSGGDPLLWEHIVDLCEYIYSKGIKIIIDTVGYTLDEIMLKRISHLVYQIGIPVDGSNQNIYKYFRLGKKDLFQVIENKLELLSKYNVKVRINTTVSKGNVDDLEKIALFIKKYINVKEWSLYEWWPLRANENLKKKMSVNQDMLLNKISDLKKVNNHISIHSRTVKDRKRDTFFISSNGEVYCFNNGEYLTTLIIGDVKVQEIDAILESPAFIRNSHKWVT